ncbi:MAG: hypothetical protein SGJ11_11295 [Phycisphaerae bacterium]|nr:hypothetical protein [Phycisphaerae bacterium]
MSLARSLVPVLVPVLARCLLIAVLGLAALGSTACETEKSYAEKQAAERNAPKPPPVLLIVHHVGGTHHRSLVRGSIWFATFGASMLVISADSGVVLQSLDLMPYGTSGPITELVPMASTEGAERLVALLDGTAVMIVSLADPVMPVVESTRRSNEIGFAPRHVSVVNNEIWISGDGGVVAWSDVAPPMVLPASASAEDAKAFAKAQASYALPKARLAELAAADGLPRGSVGGVVACNEGLVAPVGRRVYTIDDGRFVGAASTLEAIPPRELERIGLEQGFVFALQGTQGAQVGIMGPDVREIDARAVAGTVRRVKMLNGVLIAISDDELTAFPVRSTAEGLKLGDPVFIAVKGARDIDAINDNYYAVVGSFGRSFYRWMRDGRGDADTFFTASREPSRLTYASTDRRRILAGGREGSWLYTIGGEVALVNQPVPQLDGRKASAAGSWGRATVGTDGHSVVVRPTGGGPVRSGAPAANDARSSMSAAANGEVVWRARDGGEIFGVESLDGRLWIWHEDGIDVLRGEGGRIVPDGSVRVEGPVKYFYPQRVGGAAAFVSEFGGFGVLDFVEREALASSTGERVVDLDGDGTSDVQLTPAESATGLGTGGGGISEPGRIGVPIGRDPDDLGAPKKR